MPEDVTRSVTGGITTRSVGTISGRRHSERSATPYFDNLTGYRHPLSRYGPPISFSFDAGGTLCWQIVRVAPCHLYQGAGAAWVGRAMVANPAITQVVRRIRTLINTSLAMAAMVSRLSLQPSGSKAKFFWRPGHAFPANAAVRRRLAVALSDYRPTCPCYCW
jgi:hypothetical protein